MTKSMTISRIAGKAVCYLVVVIIFVVAVFPFFHLLSSALRPYSELFARPPLFLPKTFTLEWFQKVLNYSKFFQYFRNSVITALGSTLLSVAIGCMAAYSITRGGYRGKNLFSKAILVAYMFPPIILVIPLFQIVNGIGLANTHFGLILTYITFSFPFSAWMLVSYFKTIPKDIEEAAKVDGASNLRVFTQIILPLAMPAVVTAATFTFINSWNEFLYAFVLANSDVTKTLPVALYSVKGGEMMEWGPVLAWSAMLVVPSLIFFLCFSKHIVSGLTAGAVKG
jgi:ABC-type glycerol-3-phosphate transport system permease component